MFFTTKLEITGLGHNGEGVGRVEGLATFVTGALPGELVTYRVREKKKHFQRAELLEVLQVSEQRIKHPCSVFGKCGGCQLQHMQYEATLDWKRTRVEDAFKRIGKLEQVKVNPVLGMESPWRYRNKTSLQVGRFDGKTALGYFSNNSYYLVPFTDCLIIPNEFNRVKNLLVKIFSEVDVSNLKQVVLRHSAVSGEILLGLVGKTPQIAWNKLIEEVPKVKAIVEINPANGLVKLLAGQPNIQDWIFGHEFKLSMQSFVQVNPEQTKVLYHKTLEYAAITGLETVLDVYCGIGTISLALAQKAAKVIGIEVLEQSINDAKESAIINGVENVVFHAGKAEKILPELCEDGIKADVIVLDPPRSGCERKALEAIVKLEPERIVYVSCDPATLARDLSILEQNGYTALEAQPVDMFPWTASVETVVRLDRNHVDKGCMRL